MNHKKLIIAASILGIMATGAVVLSSCSKEGQHEKDPKISYYTCPMHPQVHKDHPGDCPICGMKLVPVYKEGGEDSRGEPRVRPDAGVRISPDRQQLIGLKTSKITKKPATQVIRTVGRVAFDPALAVAQREYLEIARNVPSLKDAARSNLRLKGMSEEEIDDLDRRGEPRVRPSTGAKTSFAPTSLYLPGPNDPLWIYATLYQNEMPYVRAGQEARITLPAGGQGMTGRVAAVDPTIDPMTRSARARIRVSPEDRAGMDLRPDGYVNVSLQDELGESLVIPKSAVIDTGVRKVAFVVHQGERFETKEIRTGAELEDEVIVEEGLTEGDEVVTSAAFLVDSESQLKAAVSGMGEHQH